MEKQNIIKKELPQKVALIGWALVWLGVALYSLGYIVNPQEAAFNNVVNFLFLTSVGIGATFLIALEYVTGAVWSVPMRRVSEFLAWLAPIAALIAVPLVFNLHELFQWTHKDIVAADPLLQVKEPYLNTTFFIIRSVVIFGVWKFFIWLITRNSRLQDTTGDQRLTKINTVLSAVFMPLFAISITVLSIDWAMSLEAHWYSTIYGVYFFSGTVIAALAAATLIVLVLYQRGYFPQLRRDHFYSLGALLFTFINFWAYIAFSQFMLIWYANLPEETVWFLARWKNGWEYVSILLIITQFAVPYFVLLPQEAKMNVKKLQFIAVWILIAHFIDLYWLIMPSFGSSPVFGWMEWSFPIGITGIVIVLLAWKMKRNNLIPVGDPKLKRGLDFQL